jgi:glyoxylase I family protein
VAAARLKAVPPAVHHLAVHCADLERCERFYREVLRLPVVRRWPSPEGGDRSVGLALGGEAFLALERAEGAPEDGAWRDGRAGLHLLALRIGAGERASWEARLAEAGVPVVHRTRWTLYVQDPEGNRLGLSHHPEDAP